MKTTRKPYKLSIFILLFAIFILSIIVCCSAINVKAENETNIELADTALYGDKNGGDPFIIKNGYVERNGEKQEVKNISLIKNGEYFKANPLHSKNRTDQNSAGTCTTVAMDLLFGFHNYYSDRRLIPYGYGFLDEDEYGLLKYNPLFNHQCYNKLDLGCRHIGLTDKVHDKLMDLNPFASVIALGQTEENVVNAADKFLSQYSYKNGSDKFSFGVHTFDRSSVDNQLNSGRPVMLGFSLLMTGNRHQVVAYGSATVDGDYGYIVHSGWYSDNIYDWIPANWCISFATMRSYHDHKYQSIESYENKYINGITYSGVKCSECGAQNLEPLYQSENIADSEDEIIISGVNYRLQKNTVLPYALNGKTVVGIGAHAFENQPFLTHMTLNRNIKYIADYAFISCPDLQIVYGCQNVSSVGDRAFYGCGRLQTVEFSDALSTVGDYAFYGCESLTKINLTNMSVLGNYVFYRCKMLNDIVSSQNFRSVGAYTFYNCTSLQGIDFTNVTSIGDYAFYGCANLNKVELKSSALRSVGKFAFYGCTGIQTLRIDEDVVVNDYAFGECGGLEDVYFYDLYRTPDLEKDCFPVRDFVVHIPHGMTAAYKEIFAPYTQDFADIYTTVNYWVLGGVKRTENVLYGEYLTLRRVRADGCRFAGCYTDPEFVGSRITGIFVNEKEVLDIYARQVRLSDVEWFAKWLGSIADYYVQDAYASVKKSTLSIVDIPRYYQEREAVYAGEWLYEDIKFGKYTETPIRPYIVMSGSVNTTIEDELRYIYDRINVCDEIYVVGQAARAFYEVIFGINFDDGIELSDEAIYFTKEIFEIAKSGYVKLVIPNDIYTTNQDMTEMILRQPNDISADEIPLWFYMPKLSDVYSRAKTLEMRGYPLLCSDNTLISFMRKSTDSKFRNMINKYYDCSDSMTYVAILGDRMKLADPDKTSYYTENNDRCNFDSEIFKVLEVGGDTLDDISVIFDCKNLRDKTVLMRVECNVGDINRCDESKLRECLLKMSLGIRFMRENGCRNLILMASNRYDPTRWSDRESHEFNNKKLLEMSAQIFGVEEVGFARFGEELKERVANGRPFNIIWTENLYAYETTYDAFPSV